MEEIVQINKGYRIVIPKSIRERIRIKIGDFFIIKDEGEKLILLPAKLVPKKAESKPETITLSIKPGET